jgi:hypothetical protein
MGAKIMDRSQRLAILEIVVLLFVVVSCGSTPSAPTANGPAVVAG